MSKGAMSAAARLRSEPTDIATAVALLLVVVGCALMAASNLRAGNLWLDEVIAITHANVSWPYFLQEVVRNDIHPPVYFAQLKIWGVFGDSDIWVRLNSLFWLVASSLVLAALAFERGGRLAALASLAVFLTLPATAHAVSDVRMYTFVPVMILGLWWAQQGVWAPETATARQTFYTIVLAILIAYTHALSFYFIGLFLLTTCAEALYAQKRWRWRLVRQPVIILGVVGLACLPLAASGLLRGSDAYGAASLTGLVDGVGALTVSWITEDGGVAVYLGTLFWILGIAAGVWLRETRWLAIGYVAGCVVLALAVSLLVKPMFKAPVFAAFTSPFIALFLGLAVAKARIVARAAVFAGAVAMAVISTTTFALAPPDTVYSDAADAVRAESEPGDVIVVTSPMLYWGLMRYTVGPDWGSPLAVMPLEPKPQWRRLFELMGPEWQERLGFKPETETIAVDGRIYLVGENVDAYTGDAGAVFVLHYAPTEDVFAPGAGFGAPQEVWSGGAYRLFRSDRLAP